MSVYPYCERVPYTIAIQFGTKALHIVDKYFESNHINNRVGHHISVKYLGYEDNVSTEKIERILGILRSKRLSKEPIEVLGFDVMEKSDSFFSDLLFLRVEPQKYLHNLHYQMIEMLKENIDIFLSNDYNNYIPHISCGVCPYRFRLKEINKVLFNKKRIISDWDLVLHTSKKEYHLF